MSADDARKPLSLAELKSALGFYDNLKTLDAAFSQKKTLRSIGTTIDSSGWLHLERHPGKVVWRVEKPSAVEVALSEGTMRITQDAGKPNAHVTELNAKNAFADEGKESMRQMTAWLNLDAEALFAQYKIYRTGFSMYRFEPQNASSRALSPFKSLAMVLNRAGHLESLSLEERSGDLIQIKFAKPNIVRGEPVKKQ